MDGRGWRSDEEYMSAKKRTRNKYGICSKRNERKSKEKNSNSECDANTSLPIPETIITLDNSTDLVHDFSAINLKPLSLTTFLQNNPEIPLNNNFLGLNNSLATSPVQIKRQPKLCPLNRIKFSSTITTLIKYNGPTRPSKRNMKIVSKQYSATIGSFQGTLFEELRSFIAGCSLDQYNNHLETERSNCEQMIFLITAFNLAPKEERNSLNRSLPNLSSDHPFWNLGASLNLNSMNLSGNFEKDLFQNLSQSQSCGGYVPFMNNNANNVPLPAEKEIPQTSQFDIFTIQKVVREYTNGIHQCFDLYTSFSRFSEDHPSSKKALFKSRYTALCLWENVTTEIESSLQSVNLSCCDSHPSKLYLACSLTEIPNFIDVNTYEIFLNEQIKRQDIAIPFDKTMNCIQGALDKIVRLYTNNTNPKIKFDWILVLQCLGLPSFQPMVVQLMITPLEIMTGSMDYLLKISFEPPAPSLPTVCQLLTQQKKCIKKYVELRNTLKEILSLIEYEERQCPAFDDLISRCDIRFNDIILRHLSYCKRLAPNYLKNKYISQMISDEWKFLRSISYIKYPCVTFKTFNDGFCTIIDLVNDKLKDIIKNHLPDTLHWESHRKIRDQCIDIQNRMQKLFTNIGQVIMRDVIYYSEYTFINSFKSEEFLKQMVKEEYSMVQLKKCFANAGIFIFIVGKAKKKATTTELSEVVFDLWNKFTGALHVSSKHHIVVLKTDQTKLQWEGNTVALLQEHTISLCQDKLNLINGHVYLVASDYQLLQRHKKPFGTKFESYIQRDNKTGHLLHDLSMIFNKIETVTNTITNFIESLENTFLKQLQQSVSRHDVYCALMKTIYGLAFETVTDMVHMIGRNIGFKLYHTQIIQICTNWMRHVTKSCPSGTGKIPSWAVQGLQFIAFCSDIKSLERMDEDQFETWKRNVDDCYYFIIGDKSSNTVKKGFMMSPTFTRRRLSLDNSASSDPDVSICSSTPSPVLMRTPEAYSEQLSAETEEVDFLRDSLLHDMGMIGKPSHVQPNYISQNPLKVKLNQSVGFRWIKGNVIGQGTFGVVYSCTNVENDAVIALKQIPVSNIDQGDVLKLVEEIKVNSSIQHENIISYFGYEFHQHELLIFMELCDSGSLYELSQCGLQEIQARDYTRQLLRAVEELHKRGIIHRDIKGGNIFICGTTLKLGDFGAAVRLSTVRGTRDGEFRDLHGTVAYMAPEIIRKPDEGHGRAVDIWSVGCVVLEMLSGKRPWPEYHEDIPIIFRLGKGCAPSIPDHCSSPEGVDFMNKCFVVNPADRWTAEQCIEHSFVLI